MATAGTASPIVHQGGSQVVPEAPRDQNQSSERGDEFDDEAFSPKKEYDPWTEDKDYKYKVPKRDTKIPLTDVSDVPMDQDYNVIYVDMTEDQKKAKDELLKKGRPLEPIEDDDIGPIDAAEEAEQAKMQDQGAQAALQESAPAPPEILKIYRRALPPIRSLWQSLPKREIGRSEVKISVLKPLVNQLRTLAHTNVKIYGAYTLNIEPLQLHIWRMHNKLHALRRHDLSKEELTSDVLAKAQAFIGEVYDFYVFLINKHFPMSALITPEVFRVVGTLIMRPDVESAKSRELQKYTAGSLLPEKQAVENLKPYAVALIQAKSDAAKDSALEEWNRQVESARLEVEKTQKEWGDDALFQMIPTQMFVDYVHQWKTFANREAVDKAMMRKVATMCYLLNLPAWFEVPTPPAEKQSEVFEEIFIASIEDRVNGDKIIPPGLDSSGEVIMQGQTPGLGRVRPLDSFALPFPGENGSSTSAAPTSLTSNFGDAHQEEEDTGQSAENFPVNGAARLGATSSRTVRAGTEPPRQRPRDTRFASSRAQSAGPTGQADIDARGRTPEFGSFDDVIPTIELRNDRLWSHRGMVEWISKRGKDTYFVIVNAGTDLRPRPLPFLCSHFQIGSAAEAYIKLGSPETLENKETKLLRGRVAKIKWVVEWKFETREIYRWGVEWHPHTSLPDRTQENPNGTKSPPRTLTHTQMMSIVGSGVMKEKLRRALLVRDLWSDQFTRWAEDNIHPDTKDTLSEDDRKDVPWLFKDWHNSPSGNGLEVEDELEEYT